jgi:hypothetical protein
MGFYLTTCCKKMKVSGVPPADSGVSNKVSHERLRGLGFSLAKFVIHDNSETVSAKYRKATRNAEP